MASRGSRIRAALGGALLLLLACGGCGSPGPAPSPAPPSPPAPSPSAAGSPQEAARVPEWAGSMTPQQFARFRELVQARLAEESARIDFDQGTATVGPNQLFLVNLAQRCAGEDEETWPAIVGEHFDRGFGAVRGSEALAEKMADWKWAAPRLRLRLYPPEAFPEGTPLIQGQDLPGLVSVVMVDLPETVVSVNPDTAKPWKKDDPELLRLARENLRTKEAALKFEELDTPLPAPVFASFDDRLFIASQVLVLDRYPTLIGKHGTFVIVPNRHTLVAVPVNDREALRHLEDLARLAADMEREGPGSLSAGVFWRDEGRFVALEIGEEDGHPRALAPPELLRRLEK